MPHYNRVFLIHIPSCQGCQLYATNSLIRQIKQIQLLIRQIEIHKLDKLKQQIH